mmetsp:Transcript_20741/g.25522  ORF Transcript_20741/g.25522 Transcript_20741/m.25522 type:complete len:100 (+) Transcript_20741:874-1173(+)
MEININGESTLIVANVDFNGGSKLCNLSCTIVHLIPDNIDAMRHSMNPMVSNCTSPSTVNNSPADMINTTSSNVRVICSIPKQYALSTTNMGALDLTMV